MSEKIDGQTYYNTSHEDNGEQYAYDELQAENKRLQSQLDALRWRPVSEGLPEKSGLYFVGDLMDVNNPNFVVSYYQAGNSRFNYHGTHWMPIPALKEKE